ncbi:hypothetical protein HUU05_07540 [candidate division KSB1 bacterium]|nr:hypothetical protein [candidate division KSB1 bacterium]
MKIDSTQRHHRRIVRHIGVAGLKRKLAAFEKKYSMSTPTFVKKVWSGELEESKDFIMWLGAAEQYQIIQRNGQA